MMRTGSGGEMIISHEHRFIFLHSRKAAGSSICSSLSRYLGKQDIILSAIRDLKTLGLPIPDCALSQAFLNAGLKDWMELLCKRTDLNSFVSKVLQAKYMEWFGSSASHATATRISSTLPDLWKVYFKFCVVRNPFDKTVSDYVWRTRRLRDSAPSFSEYVDALSSGASLRGIVPPNNDNWLIYTINDSVSVDFIVRFEDLEKDLTRALARTSLAWDGWLPHAKKGAVRKVGEYRRFYDSKSRLKIANLYEKELSYFKYKF
jgi:hypothetical protein